MSKAAELAALIGSQTAQGNKNLVKNGAMVIAQRATSAASDTTGTVRTVDRMNPQISSAGTWTQSQSTEVPSGQGFVNSFKLDCTTADASLAASDYVILGYRMEGLELQRLNYGTSGAKNTVLSFWVKTNKTGNYVVQMQNQRSTNKVCSFLYTVSSADTWQKVEFALPADTAATFDNDNGMSAILYWWLAAGTNWTSGTLNTTWANITNANLAVGLNVNLADSTDNEWYITGIQLEEGDVATAFEHEDIGTTLAKCQRYYYRIGGAGTYHRYAVGSCQGTSSCGVVIYPPAGEMRDVPALETTGTASNYGIYEADGVNACSSIPAINSVGTNSKHFNITFISSGNLASGNAAEVLANNNADAFLAFKSEL